MDEVPRPGVSHGVSNVPQKKVLWSDKHADCCTLYLCAPLERHNTHLLLIHLPFPVISPAAPSAPCAFPEEYQENYFPCIITRLLPTHLHTSFLL